MFQAKFIFSQLITFMDRNNFIYLACKYCGDKFVKHFTCWNQLLTLMLGQPSNRKSLRDLIVALEAHLFLHTITTASVHDSLAMKEIFYESGSYYVFNRSYNAFKELHNIHLLKSFFVVRAKRTCSTNALNGDADSPRMSLLMQRYNSLRWAHRRSILRNSGSPCLMMKSRTETLSFFRMPSISPPLKLPIYIRTDRAFHKWLKQHLKIRKFLGVRRTPSEFKSVLQSLPTVLRP